MRSRRLRGTEGQVSPFATGVYLLVAGRGAVASVFRRRSGGRIGPGSDGPEVKMIRWRRFCEALCMLIAVVGLGGCALRSAGGAVGPKATSPPPDTDLRATLEVPAALPDGQSVPVEFTLVNQSDTGLYVLTWYAPLEGVAGEIFRVTRYGEPIRYDGPLVMRGDPTPEDYVYIEAGGSVSATVDLATTGDTGLPIYDFSTPAEYTIGFLSPRISHVAITEDQMTTSVDDLGPVRIPAKEVKVRIGDSRDPSVRRTTGQAEAMIRDYWLSRKPSLSPEFRLAVAELPAHDVWEHLSVQVFRVTEGPYALETFLINGETVLRLGTAVGGSGVTSLQVSDLDEDGFAELLFTYSFGSGIHQSRIGMYAPAYADDRVYEAGTAYLGDMVLVKESMSNVGVRVVQSDDATKTLRYSGTLGHLAIRTCDDTARLSLEVSHDLPEDLLQKLKTIPAPAENEDQTASERTAGAQLEARLQAPELVRSGKSVEVVFTLVNKSEMDLYVLEWYTPLEGVAGDIFRVERCGEPVPYQGPLVMRADPRSQDYIFLRAGSSVSTTFDLASVGDTGKPLYDVSKPGDYVISFISPRISHLATTEREIASSVDDLGPVEIPSNSIVIEVASPAGDGTGGKTCESIRPRWSVAAASGVETALR